MPTGILTTFDGGKIVYGFGRNTGTLHFGWVMKLWGSNVLAAYTTDCGLASYITGYVTMV